jgi:DNA replication protein
VEQEEENVNNSGIYNTIEEEFGRTLSPIEYETISGWLNAKIDESLIKEALKEAVLNGVNNLKYIDKILYEWTKKGYKKSSDVKKRPKKEPEEIELFSYDWLDENDE